MEYLTILARSIVVFQVLFVFTKLMGKQHISQMTPLDFIVGMTIGSIAASASVELESPGLSTAFGILVWTILNHVMAKAIVYSKWWKKKLDGSYTVLVENGYINKANLIKENYTVEHLLMQLRKQSIFDLKQVHTAILEIDGSLSILKNPKDSLVTVGDMNIPAQSKLAPTILIKDGQIDQKGLSKAGLSGKWLSDQLKNRGLPSEKEVLYAAVDEQNQLHVDTGQKGAGSV
jgi:uncharacterized membrane protein YcaP (DUF421 family)